jgi:hypothetical protein
MIRRITVSEQTAEKEKKRLSAYGPRVCVSSLNDYSDWVSYITNS